MPGDSIQICVFMHLFNKQQIFDKKSHIINHVFKYNET